MQRFLSILNSIWAIPGALVIRVISPAIRVKIGTLEETRIGHFVADGTEQVMRQEFQPKREFRIYWWAKPGNSQWDRMLKRELRFFRGARYLFFWNQKIPGGASHSLPITMTGSRDLEGLYSKVSRRPKFTNDENSVAIEWMKKHGWREGQKFVCLITRDESYLSQDYVGSGKFGRDWSYHNYRNSDIESYKPGVEWLLAQDTWVIRMGSKTSNQLKCDSPMFLDYSFDDDRNDLMDIWLFANCSACITTATGPDNISLVYGRPLLFLNALPLAQFISYANSTWVPKTLIHNSDLTELTLGEYVQANFVTSKAYEEAGIKVIDLLPNEILTYIQEFWKALVTGNEFSNDDARCMVCVWDELRKLPDYSNLHSAIDLRGKVSNKWLSRFR